jgi:23S rRNA (cytosine1962-C5)-methyltransferase
VGGAAETASSTGYMNLCVREMGLHMETVARKLTGTLKSDAPVSRLVNGAGTDPAFSGLIIDRFEQTAIIHAYESRWAEQADLFPELLSAIGVRSAVLWNRDKDPRATTQQGAEVVFGEVPEVSPVLVDGVQLLLKPFKTASGGIFLDTSEVRAELVGASRNKRVLNLFCFTGSLGIAAAVGGAREVTQVDISQSVLEWAKENAALNEISSTTMRYITDDATSVLARCARRREKGADEHGYDIVIIDPPAFGTTGGKRFDLSKQLRELVALGLAALSSKGTLLMMCNETKITHAELLALAPQAGNVRAIRAPVSTFPGELNAHPIMRGMVVEGRRGLDRR